MKVPDIIIAIDGYSSTGKSTFAKLISKDFGFLYLDSGALYRGVTLFALESGFIKDGNIDLERLIPALDMLYVWSMRQMSDRNIPIDADAFVVHAAEKYVRELKDIMPPDELLHGRKRKGSRKGK